MDSAAGMRRLAAGLLLALGMLESVALGQTTLTRSADLTLDVSPVEGELIVALLGGLWTVPGRGGPAAQLMEIGSGAMHPRWSPDGAHIVYSVRTGGGSSILQLDRTSLSVNELVSGKVDGRHPTWHPDGERVAFAAPQLATGLDVFEIDLRSGTRWRLTSAPGDEFAPAWSSSGRHLAYVARDGDSWSLMLRRFGEPDRELYRSDAPITGPAWRPDGTLISFYAETAAGPQQYMAILSDPPLIRSFVTGENLAPAALRWQDRDRFVYVADGTPQARRFGDRRPQPVNLAIAVDPPTAREPIVIANRRLPTRANDNGQLVIRAARLFDGLSRTYRNDVDVVIEDGVITALTARQDWGSTPLIDLPSTTLMPGFIDAYSSLPDGDTPAVGAHLLSWGITTVVSPDYTPARAEVWARAETAGPRLLPVLSAATPAAVGGGTADTGPYLVTAVETTSDAATVDAWRMRGRPVIADGWLASRTLGTNALLGADTVPATTLAAASESVIDTAMIMISGLGDARTPGLAELSAARQAQGRIATSRRRIAAQPSLAGRGAALVIGSRPSGLPAGLALHAELRALTAAGVDARSAFVAGGANAARLLGLSGQIGEISPGARADLVFVNGDPLASVAASKDIVGVVRDGRFFSLSHLLDRRRLIVE